MGYGVDGSEAFEEFNGNEDDDEVLCLDRERDGEHEHPFVRECHSEGEEDAVDCSAGSYGEVVGADEAYELACFLGDGSADSADEIIYEKPPRAPCGLKEPSEHPECKHIEGNVPETSVHEHVGDGLEPVEIG